MLFQVVSGYFRLFQVISGYLGCFKLLQVILDS